MPTPLLCVTSITSTSVRVTWPESPCISIDQELSVRSLPDGNARRVDLRHALTADYKRKTASYTLTDLVPQRSYELRLIWNNAASGPVVIETPASTCAIM